MRALRGTENPESAHTHTCTQDERQQGAATEAPDMSVQDVFYIECVVTLWVQVTVGRDASSPRGEKGTPEEWTNIPWGQH